MAVRHSTSADGPEAAVVPIAGCPGTYADAPEVAAVPMATGPVPLTVVAPIVGSSVATPPTLPNLDPSLARSTALTPDATATTQGGLGHGGGPPSASRAARNYRQAKLRRELALEAYADGKELHLRAHLARSGVHWPPAAETTDEPAYSLDKERQAALSTHVRRTGISLPALVELIRGQTPSDYRPNKALAPEDIAASCAGYKRLAAMLEAVQHGVRVPLRQPVARSSRPLENHQSARDRLRVLRKNVRQEQDAGRCIVVDLDLLDQWPEVVISPYGVVDKAGGNPLTDGRTIQNLSFPPTRSVNDVTDKDAVPAPDYRPVEAIAIEILRLRELYPDATIYLLAGDVALAFRHVHLHSESVYLFGGVIPEDNALIIELACPFGWTGSPGYYELFGGAISHIHGQSTDSKRGEAFFSYHWVDDHVLVATGSPEHLSDCEHSLRSAMMTVLGPRAINEKKFTSWSPRLRVLGLIFDTTEMSVAMPTSKIDKAKNKVGMAYHAAVLDTTAYRSLLGSLRRVATCIRSARPFLQRLRSAEWSLHIRRHVDVTDEMRRDLTWWWSILHSPRLNGVQLNYFKQLPDPDVSVAMDASDTGLCAVDATSKHFLLYQFNDNERSLIAAFKNGSPNWFDINFRELLSSAFAALAWAERWSTLNGKQTHVHFRIDNTSAVAWHQRMSSKNSRAQVLIRLLSFWEDKYSLRFSASHIAGTANDLADAGSRSFHSGSHRSLFNSLTSGWTQTAVPDSASCFPEIWHSIIASMPLPTPPTPSTVDISAYGKPGQVPEE